jgi:hypothetical protein
MVNWAKLLANVSKLISAAFFFYGAAVAMKWTKTNLFGGDACCTGAYVMFGAALGYIVFGWFSSLISRAEKGGSVPQPPPIPPRP